MKNRYQKKMSALTARKIAQTEQKMKVLGARDEDDYGTVLPPDGFTVQLPEVDENGSFSGAYAWGKNFRYLMEHHPAYIDPDNALAGRWMFMMSRMRKGYLLSRSNFAFDYSHLRPMQDLYDITCGIGKDAHFAPDYQIGLKLGWGGLLKKIHEAQKNFHNNQESRELLAAEVDAILGIQAWITHLGVTARDMSMTEEDSVRQTNLQQMSAICLKLVNDPPETFREVCQWIAIFNMASRTYNRDGAGGQLDELLRPYYERDKAAHLIDDEDAEFYVFCLLLNDPHYYQLGGPDADGKDMCSPLSFIILDAAEKLKSSCNLTVRVFDGMDERLLQRGVEVLLNNKLGYPRFSGDKALVAGFMRNGFSAAEARSRIAVGCNWMSMPGLEYTLNDVVKINLVKVFEVAWNEVSGQDAPNIEKLWAAFNHHFLLAVKTTVSGIDFHLDHQYRNEPELLLNLLSHGPIEKGLDVSHGGATYYNMAIDGAGLATVSDSFAAVEQQVENEHKFTWQEVNDALKSDFAGVNGERIRLFLQHSDRYGQGSGRSEKWAKQITKMLNDALGGKKTPGGRNLIPGWFSWADTIRFGKAVGATPNGRHSHAPISQGANPHPGFRKDGALSAMSSVIASVQPGWGNTAPWQLEVDIGLAHNQNAVARLCDLIKTHFEDGGTLININVVDAEKIIEAHHHPEKYPDLIVRVTGFSAYFTSLSPAFRQLVVDRLIKEAV